jgi:hypothetical protein
VELKSIVRIASVLAGRRPAAFLCGHPPRVLLAFGPWREPLTAEALALWPQLRPGGMWDGRRLTAFAGEGSEAGGAIIGLLVVASTRLDAPRRKYLLALAGMMERMKAPLLADLAKRLKDDDPAAREDLLQVLQAHNFNVRQAALSMGASRGTVYKYTRRHGIALERAPAGAWCDDDDEGEE